MIETNRIKLQPLTYPQLVKYINCDNSLETELNLNKTKRIVSPELKEPLEQIILPGFARESANYLFTTLWIVIDKEKNQLVADFCFKGEPNNNGEVEIGYGTYEEYRGKGFMTEAIKAITEWALNQNNVKAVIAETDKSNFASSSVLLKNNFIKTGENETMYLWRFNVR